MGHLASFTLEHNYRVGKRVKKGIPDQYTVVISECGMQVNTLVVQ